MKWKKLGQVFDPYEHVLPNGCFGFAQSPQTLIFDNFVRVYFSVRSKDNSGKYLSHVTFADFDKKTWQVHNSSEKSVIPLGELGCFDQHGIFPFNVVRDESRIIAFTTGWNRRVSVSTDAAIGLAISEDNGCNFKKVGLGPVISASLHEPFLVGDAFVKKYNNLYHMWYIHGVKWISNPDGDSPERIYKIAHATSNDCLSWNKEGRQLIADSIIEHECQALPSVVQIGNRFHMYFCYRHAFNFRTNKASAYKLGYAFSDDLINWTRDDNNSGISLSEEGWDSEMQCYPHIFEMDGVFYLLYNGNEFGRCGFGLAKLMES